MAPDKSARINGTAATKTKSQMRFESCHEESEFVQLPELLPRRSHGIAEQCVAADLRYYGLPVFHCVQGMFAEFADHSCAVKGKGLGYG
jgi:hypothetical protein